MLLNVIFICYNKSETKQLYLCNECGSTFVEPNGFERIQFRKEKIVRAVHMHKHRMSLSKVQNHPWQHDNIKVTRWAILKWVKNILLKKTRSKHQAYIVCC